MSAAKRSRLDASAAADAGAANPYTFEKIEELKKEIFSSTAVRPEVCIICGSGLGRLAEDIENKEEFAYEDIGFPTSTVPGHAGKLIFGQLGGKSVVAMKGRFHFYEGYPQWKITMPIRLFKMMGCHTMVVTNACGGLNPAYNVGDVMVIKDHISMTGMSGANPLLGHNDERFGPRFPPMNNAYDRVYRAQITSIAEELGFDRFMRSGVYVVVSGPNYETPAECRMLHTMGADVVGMSTVNEVQVARHCGLKVLGLSLVTNKAVLDEDSKGPSHAEVTEVADKRSKDMCQLVREFVKQL